MLQKEWFHNFIGKVKIDVCLFVRVYVLVCLYVGRFQRESWYWIIFFI